MPMADYIVVINASGDNDHIFSVASKTRRSFVAISLDSGGGNMIDNNLTFSTSNSRPFFQNNRFDFMVIF
jgi:hypothetical protein